MRVLSLVTIGVVALALPAHGEEKEWQAMPHVRCSRIIQNDKELPATVAPALVWVAGYVEGVAALGNLDERFRAVGDAGIKAIGPMVLTYCIKKPDITLGEAATGV